MKYPNLMYDLEKLNYYEVNYITYNLCTQIILIVNIYSESIKVYVKNNILYMYR